MLPFDLHVLRTLARLARGITLECPPMGVPVESDKVRQVGGQFRLRIEVPELFLTLEYLDEPNQGDVSGSIVALHGADLIVAQRRPLWLPRECKYVNGAGRVYHLTCQPYAGNPYGLDGQPEYAARRHGEEHPFRGGISLFSWFQLKPDGWALADKTPDDTSVQSDEMTLAKAATHAAASAMSGEARALAMLTDHPDWSDTRIAKAVGVNRTTLYDFPKFKKARALLKGNAPQRTDRRKGRTGKRLPDTSSDT